MGMFPGDILQPTNFFSIGIHFASLDESSHPLVKSLGNLCHRPNQGFSLLVMTVMNGHECLDPTVKLGFIRLPGLVNIQT